VASRRQQRSTTAADQPEAVLSGREAVLRVEHTITGSAVSRDPALAEGRALTGIRAASLTERPCPGRVEATPLPETSCVHHVLASPGCETGGAFELAAVSVQQAADHCLVAHRLSRRLSRAGLCSLAPSLSESLGRVRLPGPDLIEDLLVAAPTSGERDADPARIVEMARETLAAVAEATGRPAHPIEWQGDERADVVVVAAGAEALPAREAARTLAEAGISAATLSVVLVRPFPEAEVRKALAGARTVLVLHDPDASSTLLEPVRAVVEEKAEIHPLPTASPARMIEMLAGFLPDGVLDPLRLAPAQEEPPARRLVVAPAGPWGEETLRRTLGALGRVGALRMDTCTRSERGATVLAWDGGGLPAGGDVLLASHPAVLEPGGALALLRPGSVIVVLAAAESSRALAQLLPAEAREMLRERELQLHWVAAPETGQEELGGDRAASWALAGAAVAVVGGAGKRTDDGCAVAGESEARWLRAGAGAVRRFDRELLEPSQLLDEVDFRATPKLPRMPAPVDDPQARKRWAGLIRRFHRTGGGAFDPGPRLPVRPAVVESLIEAFPRTSPHPFVLVPGDDPTQPIRARGLRELLKEEIEAMQAAGKTPAPALSGNLEALAGIAARLLAEQEPGSDLGRLLSAAGDEFAKEISLPEDEDRDLRRHIDALRGALPGHARVLDLRADTPLRLYLEVIAAVRTSLRQAFVAKLEGLRERLHDLLRLDEMHSDAGRAPAALAAELGGATAEHLDLDALSQTLPQSSSSAPLGAGRRRRVEEALATLEGYLAEEDRLQRPVFLRPPQRLLPVPPEQEQTHPDPLAAAVGYFDGVARRMASVFRAARTAQLEVEGAYRAERHDEILTDLDWEGFTAEELALVPPLAVVTSGRSLRERGQGSLSELLRSSRPVQVIVLDEVAPVDQAEDLSTFHLHLGYLVMAHREAFAVGSTLARPERLTQGLARMAGALRPGVALVHLPPRELTPWHALLAEAGLHGRACPSFLYDPDAGPSWADRFDLEGNPAPDRAWPVHEIAYLANGAEQTLEAAFTFADAVAFEPAYLRHLRIVPPSAWDDSQLPLADWLEGFDPEGREDSIPYLWVVDDRGELQRAVVTRELAVACRDRLRGWRVLQELAGYENAYAERAAAAAREHALAEAAEQRAQLEQAHSDALAKARSEGARESMERLAAVLLSPDGLSAPLPGPVPPVPPPAAPPQEPAAEAVAQAAPELQVPQEEEDLSFDEPYIDGPLCTTCNECTNLNSRLFQYNAEKQAFIADATAGTFAELVKAAELCPARCIHPGKPRNGDETATPELIERAAAFN
jgi:ferredoxin